ncbi:hypothetical protein Pfo_020148 [Paulownia fortunei]|nr:hypothetical protein Pfo_020148 [Paulownia fortunei]
MLSLHSWTRYATSAVDESAVRLATSSDATCPFGRHVAELLSEMPWWRPNYVNGEVATKTIKYGSQSNPPPPPPPPPPTGKRDAPPLPQSTLGPKSFGVASFLLWTREDLCELFKNLTNQREPKASCYAGNTCHGSINSVGRDPVAAPPPPRPPPGPHPIAYRNDLHLSKKYPEKNSLKIA